MRVKMNGNVIVGDMNYITGREYDVSEKEYSVIKNNAIKIKGKDKSESKKVNKSENKMLDKSENKMLDNFVNKDDTNN